MSTEREQNGLDKRKTFRLDMLRAPFQGFVQEGLMSLALLVAIRYFEGADTAKALIAASGSIGLLLNPLSLSWIARSGQRVSKAASFTLCLSAVALLCSLSAKSLWLFCLCCGLAAIFNVQIFPLILQIYTRNYPANERGKRLSIASIIAGFGAATATYGAGRLLDLHIGTYPMIFVLLAAATLLNAAILRRMPSDRLEVSSVGNPWKSVQLAVTDRVFGFMLSAWMLMGIANLMTLPLRTEYMANPDFAVNATNSEIAFIMVGVPAIARMIASPIWGALFDKVSVIIVRASVNVFFLLSIGIFFNTSSLFWLGFAMACNGIANAGGSITWSLWVTKLAPKDKVAAYMSVHTASTGLRGVMSPFLGFYLLSVLSTAQLSFLGVSLVVLSTLMFVGLVRHPRFRP
ncbi:MAG: MFS transporter [Opitutales bacterium]|nr:MFS transporter [Opitutales bacterium]NRA28190.1 MFS transporter [Opitutales bacterium]